MWRMRGLTSQERKLVLAARHGQRLRCSEVRADVIRDLLLGRYGALDPRGVQLSGARIEGALDLEGVIGTAGMNLTDCRLSHPVVARDAEFPWLELEGCRLPALLADRLRVTGGLFLRRGFHATGWEHRAVRLPGARIGGNLECDGAVLTSVSGVALHAEGIRVEGSVFLRRGFSATADSELGAVLLSGGFIGRSLNLLNSKLINTSGLALSASGLRVEGELMLGGGSYFRARSHHVVIDLAGSTLGGLQWSRFATENSESGGAWIDLEHVSAGWARVDGDVLCEAGYNQACIANEILIGGFTYGSLSGADWRNWLHWLRSHTREYAAQSYWQLASVERAAGNDLAVRHILIAQQDDRRIRGKFDNRWSRFRHRAWGVLAGYGYRIGRTVVATLAVLLFAGLLGLWAGHTPIRDGRYAAGHTSRAEQPFTSCSTFEQIGLGIDRGLPLSVTGVRERCDLDTISRRGQAFAVAIWLLQVAVWLLATLVVVGYSGLIRKVD
jgi:hypothetical protein